LTTALEPEALCEEAAWVAAVEAALVALVLLFELPPQAASRALAASVGMRSFRHRRIFDLLWGRVGSDSLTSPLKTEFWPFPSRLY
jgi:hypothetical protein